MPFPCQAPTGRQPVRGITVKYINNMTKIEEKINDILSEWNPLCVDSSVSRNEYKKYIPLILASKDNWGELTKCMEHILETMEIDYTLECVKVDVYNICKVIYHIH